MAALLEASIGQPASWPTPPAPCLAGAGAAAAGSTHHAVSGQDDGLSVTSGHIYLFVFAALFLMAILGAAAHCVVRHKGSQLAKLLERCSSGARSQGAAEPDFLQRRVQEHAEHHAALQQRAEAAGMAVGVAVAHPAEAQAADGPVVVYVVVNPDSEVSCAVQVGAGTTPLGWRDLRPWRSSIDR
ncbi:hypothetical protein ABPG77_005552 [Micractinium sp. CCAP 211/92]